MGQASRVLGIDRARLSAAEGGTLELEPGELRTMADAYGTTVAWLTGAEPVVPDNLRQLLRDSDVTFGDLAGLLETFGMIYKPERQLEDAAMDGR